MKEYLDLLNHIVDNSKLKCNRTGVDTYSTFGYYYEIDLQNGFPLLTTKKMKWENIVFEILWFLSGDSSNKFFEKHNIKFWKKWEDENGNLPEAYGRYWRDYPYFEYDCSVGGVGYFKQRFDQFSIMIKELRCNLNSRRVVLTNWYPPSAWTSSLPPCHLMSIFNVQYDILGQPELNLHMTQRSCDVPVGVPYNIAGYALLLEIVSKLTGIKPRFFGHTLVDAHIYVDQTAGVIEQLNRRPFQLPKLIIDDKLNTLENLDDLICNGTTEEILDCFKLEGYESHPFIKFPIAV
jgi:thymidylate synthase